MFGPKTSANETNVILIYIYIYIYAYVICDMCIFHMLLSILKARRLMNPCVVLLCKKKDAFKGAEHMYTHVHIHAYVYIYI